MTFMTYLGFGPENSVIVNMVLSVGLVVVVFGSIVILSDVFSWFRKQWTDFSGGQ